LPDDWLAKAQHPQTFDKLADAVEKAIKAALIENHGSLPEQHDHSHWFRSVSHGRLGHFNAALRVLVQRNRVHHRQKRLFSKLLLTFL